MNRTAKNILLRYLIILAAVILAYVYVIKPARTSAKEVGLTEWNVYHGQYAGYDVEIHESKTDGQWFRIVHLTRKDDSLSSITGHTYDQLRSDNWSRIFLCGNENVGLSGVSFPGCNSMEFDERGDSKWELCPADKDAQVNFAVVNGKINASRTLLAGAVKAVYNREHRIQTLQSFKAKNPRL